MFLKRTRVHSKRKTYTYLQVVESVWRNGRSTQRVIANLGREDQIDPRELNQLLDKILKTRMTDDNAGWDIFREQ